MVDAAFNMIRQNSYGVAAVSIHLLETIATVAGQAHRQEDRDTLMSHAAMVLHGCSGHLSAKYDRDDLQKRYGAVLEALNGKRGRGAADTVPS
jgi:uncharacterized membrane protein